MRSEPNNSPYLPPPEGRMQLSLNPFNMIQQVFGKTISSYAKKFVCLIICIVLLVLLIPQIFGDLITDAITNIIADTKNIIVSGAGKLTNAILNKS